MSKKVENTGLGRNAFFKKKPATNMSAPEPGDKGELEKTESPTSRENIGNSTQSEDTEKLENTEKLTKTRKSGKAKHIEAENAQKMRTSIMLSPDVVAGIEVLRLQARKNGERITTSTIVEDAVRILLRQKRISI